MEGVSIEDKILNLIKNSKKPLSFEEILNRLGLDQKGRKSLKKALKSLRKSGKVLLQKGKYSYVEEEIVSGKVIPYPAGFGFLQIGEGKRTYTYLPLRW